MNFAKSQEGVLSNVKQALADGEIDQAEKLVHALKGVAGNIGAMEVFRRAQDLDLKLKTGQAQDSSPQAEELAAVLEPMLAVFVRPEDRSSSNGKAGGRPAGSEEIKALLAKLNGLLEENDLEAKEILPELRSKEVGDETRGFAMGAEDNITKPVSPPVVLARVRTHQLPCTISAKWECPTPSCSNRAT